VHTCVLPASRRSAGLRSLTERGIRSLGLAMKVACGQPRNTQLAQRIVAHAVDVGTGGGEGALPSAAAAAITNPMDRMCTRVHIDQAVPDQAWGPQRSRGDRICLDVIPASVVWQEAL